MNLCLSGPSHRPPHLRRNLLSLLRARNQWHVQWILPYLHDSPPVLHELQLQFKYLQTYLSSINPAQTPSHLYHVVCHLCHCALLFPFLDRP